VNVPLLGLLCEAPYLLPCLCPSGATGAASCLPAAPPARRLAYAARLLPALASGCLHTCSLPKPRTSTVVALLCPTSLVAHTGLNSTKKFTNLKVNLKRLGLYKGAKMQLVSYEFFGV